MRILSSTSARSASAAGLLTLLALSSCSSESSAGDGGRDLFITACSLGCNDGQGGEHVSCSIVNTYQNQELSILFSDAIDLFSVNSSSFRVVNAANGTSPSGQFFLDPFNEKRLIFRPSLSFDANGNPIFGFDAFTTYEITIPGSGQGDPPPFITSRSGRENRSRLQCAVFTSEGIIDPVPGTPAVEYFVTTVASYDANGDPDGFDEDVQVVPDPEPIDVWRETDIRFEFNEVMNIATLVNPVNGQAPFLRVERDDDGNLATLNDRQPIEGVYTYAVDQESLTTTLFFDPDGSLPSAGPDAPLQPVRIAVTVPESVQDLVGNGVTIAKGGGTRGFVPEEGEGGPLNLPQDGGEDFLFTYPSDESNEDGNRSGAAWGGGRLAPGVGGSAGRLGDLFVPQGTTLVLDTDGQSFPLGPADGLPSKLLADIIGNPDPVQFPDTLGNFPDEATVDGGVFAFASIVVASSATLRLEGANPARIFSRGPFIVKPGGRIDVSGVSPEDHDSGTLLPSDELPTPVNAPNGADGGFGGDRFDMGGNTFMWFTSDAENDPVDIGGDNQFGGSDADGRSGTGVGRSDGPSGNGGGPGGARWPDRYPIVNNQTEGMGNNDHGVNFNKSSLWNPVEEECRSFVVGAPGGGGAYALDGAPGVSLSLEDTADFFNNTASNNAPTANGGDATTVGLEPVDDLNQGYAARKLEPELGNLRGGSGGGGGGNHPFASKSYDVLGQTTDCIGPNVNFGAWHDHSGARGGFGGGAIQAVSGRRIQIDGTIDASGGDGGSARLGEVGDPEDFGQYAMPGGGGSGGAILLQSLVVDLGNPQGSLLVPGGMGGVGVWTDSAGGAGSPGLVRIEDFAGLVDRQSLAPFVRPYDAGDGTFSLDFLSVDDGMDRIDDPDHDGFGWLEPRARPSSVSSSSSCWIRPEGDFFSLRFNEDAADPDTGDPDEMGWNMLVIWQASPSDPEILVPFRGANGLFNNSFETEFGKLFGPFDGSDAAPIVVRFQGARAVGDFERCDFDLNDLDGNIISNSITPWVDHPALLNEFSPSPNMIRFVVLFDGTIDNDNGDTPGSILTEHVRGVTGLEIRAFSE